MGTDVFEITVNLVKIIFIFLMIPQVTPLLVWIERRGSAFIQNRFGPNRVGPLGLTQLLADAVKFLTKEAFIPEKGRAAIYYAAPAVALIPAALALGALPLSVPVEITQFELFGKMFGPYVFPFQGYELGIGIVFVLGASSLGAYALLMAGWGSSNKYSLFGALRASAQVISYELALGLALVGILLLYQTFDFQGMIASQVGPLSFMFRGNEIIIPFLPNWGIFYQPLGFVLFFVAVFAETNRLPFDLPEAEGELVAGFHTEYGGLKMNLFYIGEYGHMIVSAVLLAIFYFGGYNLWIPFPPFSITPEMLSEFIASQGFSPNLTSIFTALTLHLVLLAKVFVFLWIFVWVRWSIPRFRYDQLMDLGWKTMLPWALANTVVTMIVIYVARATGG